MFSKLQLQTLLALVVAAYQATVADAYFYYYYYYGEWDACCRQRAAVVTAEPCYVVFLFSLGNPD